MLSRPQFLPGVVIALVVAAADQMTKWWILDAVMRPPRVIEVTPFFNLVLTWNRGVSFGLFNSGSPWNTVILSALALVIVVGMLIWLWRTERRTICLAVGLVVGGAVGNVIDRLIHGAVVDFLDMHAFGQHWPAFNLADSAITVGAAILILDSLFAPAERHRSEDGTE